MSRTPGSGPGAGRPGGLGVSGREVEPAPGRRPARHLEGLGAAADARRGGLVISAGKMSNLWSGQPVTIRLDDLEVICEVLGCEPGDLLVREPGKIRRCEP